MGAADELLRYSGMLPFVLEVICTEFSNKRAAFILRLTISFRSVDRILVEKPQGHFAHRRHRRKWEVNVRMVLREIFFESVDSTDLTLDMDKWRKLVITLTEIGGS